MEYAVLFKLFLGVVALTLGVWLADACSSNKRADIFLGLTDAFGRKDIWFFATMLTGAVLFYLGLSLILYELFPLWKMVWDYVTTSRIDSELYRRLCG